MAVKQLPKISDLPEPPDRLVGDQERFDVLTFNSLKAQKKMVNDDLNKTLIPALNEFAVDVNASVDAAALSERNAHDSEEVAKRKAGEASGSAGAAKVSEDNAKVSETNALASKNAAALSAESAEADRVAAEAARDEAQDLANVGYVSEGHAGLAKVDGKTTRADAGGVITVKDVAIGGNLEDLASARGQIGPARELGNNVDFNTVTEAGLYLINATGSVNAPRGNQAFFLQVVRSVKGAITKNLFQIAYNYSSVADLVFIRQYRMASSSWSVWTQFITSSQVGDGLTVNNGIISVPEYEGATVSTAGTSGLVPPATAGQHESFLTGGGEYKPALTKISDSVNLADSKTAASAKAVKAAYDKAVAAQDAVNNFSAIPTGGIIMWSGAVNAIPAGWALCDGANSTPDLRDRFVVGAGRGYAARATGGVASHTHGFASATIGYTTLDTHSATPGRAFIVNDPNANVRWSGSGSGDIQNLWGQIAASGASWGHTHSLSASLATSDNRPPFYALAFIMKL